jgi:hypothetical protein
METTISLDAFTCFYLLSFALLFVAARCVRNNDRSPTGVAERGAGRLPERPDRIADGVHGRLTETGPRWEPTCVRESDINRLEGYARQFEEAIENIRLSRQDLRQGK